MMALSRFAGLTAMDCTRPPFAALAMTPSPASGILGGIWWSGVEMQPDRRTTTVTTKAHDKQSIARSPGIETNDSTVIASTGGRGNQVTNRARSSLE